MLSSFAGGTLFGERHGEAPLQVLALHGWARTHQDFEGVFADDKGHTLRAIALDLPGFGATPGLERAMSSRDFAEMIAPILDEASQPVVLVGHSHGGRVAVELASLRPEQVAGIVLVAAPVLRLSSSTKPSWRYRLARKAHAWHLLSDERFEARRARSGSRDYNAAHGVLRDTLVTIINESFEDELRALRCPIALVWGERDGDVPLSIAERARDLIRSAGPVAPAVSLVVLEGVGHLVPTSAPSALRTVIDGMVR